MRRICCRTEEQDKAGLSLTLYLATLCMNEVDGHSGMNEIGEEQVKSCYIWTRIYLFIMTQLLATQVGLEKYPKKECSYSFWLLGIAYSLTSIFLSLLGAPADTLTNNNKVT